MFSFEFSTRIMLFVTRFVPINLRCVCTNQLITFIPLNFTPHSSHIYRLGQHPSSKCSKLPHLCNCHKTFSLFFKKNKSQWSGIIHYFQMDGKSRNDWAVRFTLYNQHITAVCSWTCLTRKKTYLCCCCFFSSPLFTNNLIIFELPPDLSVSTAVTLLSS